MKLPLLVIIVIFLCFGPALGQIQVPSDREGLLKGDGMGMAMAAETNGFPGPKHVLELKRELGLTPDQITKTESIFKDLKASAVAKGKEVIKAEEELAHMFKDRLAEKDSLRRKILEIARLRGELRFVHLQAHLHMIRILTPDQVQGYNTLRNHAPGQ